MSEVNSEPDYGLAKAHPKTHFLIIAIADHTGRAIQVFPSPNETDATVLFNNLREKTEGANDNPKGKVSTPVAAERDDEIEFPRFKKGISYLVTECMPSTLNGLSTVAGNVLGSRTGMWIRHLAQIDSVVAEAAPPPDTSIVITELV